MSIEEEVRERLTAALKAKDLKTANVLRMINTKVMQRRTAPDFQGEVNDALYTEVIAAYRKSLIKAKAQFEKAGERGAESIAELEWEADYCAQFLPSQMSDDQLAEVVRAAIAQLGATEVKMAGRVVGAVMKAHRGKVDAGRVKAEAEAQLSRGT